MCAHVCAGGEEEGGENFLTLTRACTHMRAGVEEWEKELSTPHARMHACESRQERTE